jgi:hypothetical protein
MVPVGPPVIETVGLALMVKLEVIVEDCSPALSTALTEKLCAPGLIPDQVKLVDEVELQEPESIRQS